MTEFRLQIRLFVPDFMYRLGVRIVLMDRRIRYGFPFRKIPLTQGKYAIVDVEDFESLNSVKWHAVEDYNTWYAFRSERINGRNSSIQMHRKVINPPDDKCVDHINHNGLDNRKANLRLVSREQNVWNTRKHRGKLSSKYKGVSKRYGKWRAYIGHKGKMQHIGYFDDELAAARAYDGKAKELFGEYACLNFPGLVARDSGLEKQNERRKN
jgi:hypothetical protein